MLVSLTDRSKSKIGSGKTRTRRHMFMPLITILGIYTHRGRMPLSWLAETLVNPSMKNLQITMRDLIKEGLPYERVFKYIKAINSRVDKMMDIPNVLQLMELDPNSPFAGQYPQLQENLKIMQEFAFLPSRKRSQRQ